MKKENDKDKHQFVPVVDGNEEKNASEQEKIQPEYQQMAPDQPLTMTQSNQTETHTGKGYKRYPVLYMQNHKFNLVLIYCVWCKGRLLINGC